MRKLYLALILCTALVSGCSHPMPNNTSSYIQENLLVECTLDTPIPEGLTGADVYKTLNEWQTVYNQCSAGKHALIEAVRNDNN